MMTYIASGSGIVSIVGRLFERCACHRLEVIPLLALILLTWGPIQANAEPDPVAAMVARVSPAEDGLFRHRHLVIADTVASR
jgi:hypothetical protein